MHQDEKELIKKLGKLLEEKTKEGMQEATGACVYSAGSGTYCAVLTQGSVCTTQWHMEPRAKLLIRVARTKATHPLIQRRGKIVSLSRW